MAFCRYAVMEQWSKKLVFDSISSVAISKQSKIEKTRGCGWEIMKRSSGESNIVMRR